MTSTFGRRIACFTLALTAVFGCGISLFAGTISGPPFSGPAPAVSGPGLGDVFNVFVITLSPNNDNAPNPNVDNNIELQTKRFDFSDYIDIEFSVTESSGVTEYRISESVDNNTGSDWARYNMYLGFGTGAGFTLSGAGDGLDFDTPDNDTPPSSGAFLTITRPNEDTLEFSNGTHSSGVEPYLFRIDVPDLLSHGNKFTLRQVPIVPEPSAMLLVMAAFLAGGAHLVNGRRCRNS
jgi:hypothetical protein